MAGDKERLKRRIARLTAERDAAALKAARLETLAVQTIQPTASSVPVVLSPAQALGVARLALEHLENGLKEVRGA